MPHAAAESSLGVLLSHATDLRRSPPTRQRPAGKKKKARPEDVISIDSNNTEGTASSLVTIASRSSTWSGAATALPLSLALLEKGDDSASEGVIAAFESDPVFKKFAKREMRDILARDKEDDEKASTPAPLRAAAEAPPPHPPRAPPRRRRPSPGLSQSQSA